MAQEQRSPIPQGKRTWWDSGRRRVVILGLVGVLIAVIVGLAVIAAGARILSTTAGKPVVSPTVQAILPPSNVDAVSLGPGTITISWTPSPSSVVGYRIYRASGRHGAYTIIGSVNAWGMNTFTDNSDFTPGATYDYTVTAFDHRGESAPTVPIIAAVLAAPVATPTLPVPPTLGPLLSLKPTAVTRTHASGTGGNQTLATGRTPGQRPTPTRLPTSP